MVTNKAEMLQGFFFGLFGLLSAAFLSLCALILIYFVVPFSPVKAGFGEFRGLPISPANLSVSLMVISAAFVTRCNPALSSSPEESLVHAS